MIYMLRKLRDIIFFITLLLATEVSSAVNVAVIAPMGELYATAGKEVISGVRTAIDEINNNGGLLGEKINLIEVEDQCNDSLSVSTAQMMALNNNEEYKISAVIGPYCLNQFRLVTDTFANAKIFQILPTAVNETYADNKHSGLVKMVGYKEQQAFDFYQYYKDNFGWMRVALIFDNNNKEIAQSLQKVFMENQKNENLIIYNFEDYSFDFDDIAKQAINDKTQMAFILSDGENAARMAKELKSEKKKYIIFVNKYQVMPEFEKIMGSLMDNCYFMGLPSLKNSPEFTETLVKLRLLGIEPEGLAVYGYSAVNLWGDLVKKANSFKYLDLAKALKDNTFDSGWGKLMFVNGNPLNSINYSIYQYNEEEYTQVY